MGRLNIFVISFLDQLDVYHSGDVLQGHVTVELTKPMEIEEMKLSFEGNAHVHWTEDETHGSGDDKKTKTVHYWAREEYFDHDIVLFGKSTPHGDIKGELPEGRHEFPFQFTLPPNLPSSYEHKRGRVRYVVKCTIDRTGKLFDYKTKRAFTVLSSFDLNSDMQFAEGKQGSKEKHLCCWCCKSGPINASFHIDRTGYVPGEAIKIFAEMSNGTDRKMSSSYVYLIMHTEFFATKKTTSDLEYFLESKKGSKGIDEHTPALSTRHSSKVVATVSRPGFEGHSEDVWSGEELVVPPLPPTHLVNCSIIDIKYALQFCVEPAGLAFDLEIPLEIVIGTIPLRTGMEQHPPMPPVGYDASDLYFGASAPPPQAGMLAILPDLPPPSYSEAVTGAVNIGGDDDEYTKGELTFTPHYTYYDWGHKPTPNSLC